ncbi:5-formyltetrahydrofolate cyclo-ligase [Allorhizobium undicola]|uniref:5-formyltetrahydrofolate cyclo-ligase n=1 Tax=Allorhizobium undicola TaxID=78527 RepID=UPI0004831705|nr:5-formyltetrahydrofolate cyclo-ligase [Allorhizobium undicola]
MTQAASIKQDLRRACLARRDLLSLEQRAVFSTAIASAAVAVLDPVSGKRIAGFYPIRSEVDVLPLLALLRRRGALIGLPVVLDRETIVFRLWEEEVELVKTGFGTRGPGPDAAIMRPDLLLMPLAGFDAAGNRIGYGAGHYDRAIAAMIAAGHRPRLIGLAFACQEVERAPAEPHDMALDGVITETGFRDFRT